MPPRWALAGCAGQDDDAGLPEISATPEVTASAQWDQNAKPQRPEDVKSEQGLPTYIDYLALMTPHTLATHESSVLASSGDRATCVPCARAGDISTSYGNDIVLYEERPSVSDMTSAKAQSKSPAMDVAVTYDVMWAGDRWELINYATQS
jgi:hypothetical protein